MILIVFENILIQVPCYSSIKDLMKKNQINNIELILMDEVLHIYSII